MSKYVKTPMILQMEHSECGAAALAVILSYYGRQVPLEQLRIDAGVSRDGCNASNILKAAEKYQLSGNAYELDMEGLDELTLPCILHWSFNHFVVYEGKKGKYYLINDPATGRRSITTEEMERNFTGIALEFEKEASFQNEKKESRFLKMVRNNIKKEKSIFLQLLLTGIFLSLPAVLMPLLIQIFLDHLMTEYQNEWFWEFLLLFLAVLLFQSFWILCRGTLLRQFKKAVVLERSFSFLHHMLRLPVNFYEQRYPGDLSERIFEYARVSEFLAGDWLEMLLNTGIAILCFGALFFYSISMAVCVGILVFLFLLINIYLNVKMENCIQRQRQAESKLAGTVYAGVSISRTLKASGAEDLYVGRILGHCAKVNSLEQETGWWQEVFRTGSEVFPVIVLFVELFFGTYLVSESRITSGSLAASLFLILTFLNPLMKLISFSGQIQKFKVDLLRTEDIMVYEKDERFREENTVLLKNMPESRIQGRLEVRDLYFGYVHCGPPVLKKLSFSVEAGSSLAVIGQSGSGKSTIARILSGLYRPWSGEILIDGKPMREFSGDILRAGIGVVNQEPTLFSGTIRENLSMWNPAVREEDIIQAAKDACIHDVITRLPGAYGHWIQENGRNFSGGEKQRMEIARALSKNPAILILDEATSALDAWTEKQILNNIKRRGCTCIIIAHRFSAIRDCVQILEMKNGEGAIL